ncbi:hypothetical protein TCE0_033f09665 [Talaromyces pinophilus]|uniref:NADAR domain-containing protein n=1 Tax=Talaromyces pinophilus TaxID=128442 RepID=A0A6V8HBZ1_TALPI|nr:hypothetical protein TCE0_033f09665 [Talaromyces pinophilus]
MTTPLSIDTNNPVYFWRPEGEYGFCGQWWPSTFTWKDGDKRYTYANAEQYMMHRKALLFGGPDDPITLQIQNGWKLHPRTIRDLGRKIPNFSEEAWEQNRYGFVLEGNYLKFSQDEELKQKLLATGNRELVEASPRDRIWGVGFGAANAGANRERWGLNLLGKVLMETRERLVRENSQ